jgi:hydroxyacylglutathione hydrolase
MKVHLLTFSPFEVNTYIVSDKSKECVIIDPACYNKEEEEYLTNYISFNNLKPVRLIQTHCHLDHVFGNKFVCDTYQLKTEASKEEEFNLNNAEHAAKLYGVEMKKPYPIETFIKEGDTVKFGFSQLNVLHVPGHTAGSLVYYSEKDNFAIVGDVLFKGSIGRTDLPGGDYETLISQIKAKLLNFDKDMIVYSGHGPETTIGDERGNNPFLSGKYNL